MNSQKRLGRLGAGFGLALTLAAGAITATSASATAMPAPPTTASAKAVAVPVAATARAVPAGVRGMDVSEYQGAITAAKWSSTYAQGARFVYIKASGGVLRTNANFASQWSGSAKAGLLHGAYHLAAPNTASGGDQARFFKAHGGQWTAGGSTLPPMLDLEINDAAASGQPGVGRCYDLTPTKLAAWITDFSNTTKTLTGRAPIIYTAQNFWSECLHNTTAFNGTPLFVADYDSVSKPVVPTGWADWALWQYSPADGSPFPGDQDVFNGTLTSLRLLADPTWGSGTQKRTAGHDYSGDGKNDLLATTTTGVLRDYRGNGKGGFASPAVANIGTGFQNYAKIVTPGDMNGDGRPDLYAIDKSGATWFYPGVAGGKLGARVASATGWNRMSAVVGVGDFTGDGKNDVVTRDPAGVLWLYVGAGNSTFSGRVQLSVGWNAKNAIVGVGDLSGDGYPDLLARDGAGNLTLYAHTPKGFATPRVISTGWSKLNSIVSVGDFNGDGKTDVLARDASTRLWLYPGNGAGRVTAPKSFGTGWGTLAWLG